MVTAVMSFTCSLFSDKVRCFNQSKRALYGNFIINIYILKTQFIKVDIKGSRYITDLLQTRLGLSSNDRLIVKWLDSFVRMVRRILLHGVHTLGSGNEKKPFSYSMFTVLLFTKPVPGVWSVREAARKLGRNWVFREGVVLLLLSITCGL